MSDNVKIEIELVSDIDDVNAIQIGIAAMETATPRMREATLKFLWDKYITHADKYNSIGEE